MKKNITLLCLVFTSMLSFAYESDCAEAQSKALYVKLHTKKALKADNFDHQKYFAKRAVKVFEETQNLMNNCACNGASDAIYDGIENLKKAIDPLDWDAGRFYTQKALVFVEDLITAFDNCSLGNDSNKDAFSNEVDNIDLKKKELNLIEAQQELLKKQQTLLEEQKQLEAKLNKQKTERSAELRQQKELKSKAEIALNNFENSILELAKVLDCREAYNLTFESYNRAEKTLESESLSTTKKYYTQRAKDISSKVLVKLQDCSRK
ncbi:MAG: hypothetical protein V3U92_14835 [Cellulophaga sp.]